ncbi:MAG: RNA polymerase sigma-70 factor [Bacteroidales bacterium]|nr:RNA polymerase sigma-70 factor [Bacteroidales bacterium]
MHGVPLSEKQAYKQLPDNELVAAVKKGDDRAFDALFLRYFPQVRRFMQALVKDDTLAEDLAQMVFMKVWLYRERLDAGKSLKNYLIVLSRNSALDVFKSKQHLLMSSTAILPERAAPERTEHLAEFKEARLRILKAVEEMPPQRREVFKMSRFGSLSNEEIAHLLGLSVRTVEKHIQLALQDLHRYGN